ncbi:ABC transporter permease [Aquisalibacillus elongatus]|uniref:ABC-2 family transporter n=1 Tax=Aquisalibacillus elongatus TaxID=485577 RepID=A0A3N5C1T0_9BACI|nr:ABC transporter permease [Aquisalibacillus elongatus]RPF50131.1 ABC-2 family transporter [Aquisalibacillus elongatus]
MRIIVKKIFKNKWTWLFLVFMPLIAAIMAMTLVDSTSNDLRIPVVVVDSHEQPITDDILSEIKGDDTFYIKKETSIPRYALERGEVEAIFVIPENLEEKINSSDLEKSILWYRNKRSVFDGLFKEQLASTIMKRAVRAEAANIVINEQPEQNWNETYDYGLRYFEPEPIFQLNFEEIQSVQNDAGEESNQQYILLRFLIWIYMWIVLAMLAKIVLDWKQQAIFDRMSVVHHSHKLRHAWLIMTILITGILSLSLLLILQHMMLEKLIWFDVFRDVLLILGSAVIYYMMTYFIRRKETLWAFALSYSTVSTVVFFLVYYQFLTLDWWTFLFLPSWILM